MGNSYREIKADVMARLLRGQWRPGEMLPGEADLAETYGCARATVNRALRELAAEGVLERKRKAGTLVRRVPVRQARFDVPATRAEVEARGSAYRYALLARAVGAAPDWLSARIGLDKGAEVVHLRCLHRADENPFQIEERWINLAVLPSARRADFETVPPNEWLVATIPYTEIEVGFSAVAATGDDALALGCAPGDPLLQMDRTTWFEGRAVTFVRLRYGRGHRMVSRP